MSRANTPTTLPVHSHDHAGEGAGADTHADSAGGMHNPHHAPMWRALLLRRATQVFALAVLLLVAWPMLFLLLSVFDSQAHYGTQLQALATTVLPRYALTSLALCISVCAWVAGIGTTAATLVALFDFKGRKTLEWALLLPLAMPAYVCAYAYTDFLQYAGPAQSWLRTTFGLQGRVLPEVRSFGGAVVLLSFTLYPYVYLLVRTALLERSAHALHAARLLGASVWRRITQVALPMARPAIMAGVALALMETLADYGVSSYFGIETFTTGIYKAWLTMDAPALAALLSVLLLLVVGVLVWLERRAQARLRFSESKASAAVQTASRQRLHGWRAALAFFLCVMPILLGFVLPVLMMTRPLLQTLLGTGDAAAPADDYEMLPAAETAASALWAWARNSMTLASLGALLAVAVALLLAFAQRVSPSRLVHAGVQTASMGYALPGAVVVVGLLLPWMLLARVQPQWNFASVLTTTLLGVLWAYCVRFCAVALQSLQSGYSRLPTTADDAVRTLGQGRWRLLTRVHLPMLRGSLLTALLLVFVDVMKELPATLVLRPFDYDTLAVMAYQLARDERLSEAALPSLAIVAFGLLPVLLLSRTIVRAERASAAPTGP